MRAAFQEENNGPGQLLGYRVMHKQIREKHGLAAPRGLTLDEKSNLHKVCLVQTCCKYRLCIGLHPLRKWWLPSLHKIVYDVMTLDDEDGLQRRKAMGKEKRKRGLVGAFTSLVG